MGASSSVSHRQFKLHGNLYISYDDKDICGEILHDELVRTGFNILQGRGVHEYKSSNDNDNEIECFTNLVEEILKTSDYIIICISENTVCSFYQAIEINSAMKSPKNIIYLMTSFNFTPLNRPYLNGLVKHHIWLPAYDDTTIESTLKYLGEKFILLDPH